MGQCNDPYWHGVFGGLYLPHLRQSAYIHLIEAEKKLSLDPGFQELDFDLDGRQEVLCRTVRFNYFIKPSFGGAIVEIDFLPDSRNLSNVLARRPESYHAVQEEERAEGKSIHEMRKKLPPQARDILRYDWHSRYSLLDHFLHPDSTKERFMRVDYGEQGDFVNQPYEFRLEGESLFLEREGGVWIGSERIPVKVRKELRPSSDGLQVLYELENLSSREAEFLFGSEWNFYLIGSELEVRGGRALLLGGRLVLEPAAPKALWHFPLRTLSQSEEGYDIIHQGYCLLPLWKINTPGNGKASFEIKLKETHGT